MPLNAVDLINRIINPDGAQVNSANSSEIISDAKEVSRQALLDMINNLSAGDTLLGKVVSSSKNSLQILTEDGFSISAKNGDNVVFQKGQSVLFQVQKTNGREVTLRPLYQNTSIQKTAETAVRSAGLPVNSRSLEMTIRNMEYGNPIDRKALCESFKDVAINPEVPVKVIVDLQQIGLEVNQTNIRQYQAYSNMENSITDAFSQVADELYDEILSECEAKEVVENEGVTWETNGRTDFPVRDAMIQIVDDLQKYDFDNGITVSKEEIEGFVALSKKLGIKSENLGKLLSDTTQELTTNNGVNQETIIQSETKSYDISTQSDNKGYSPIEVLKNLLQDVKNAPTTPTEVIELVPVEPKEEEPEAPSKLPPLVTTPKNQENVQLFEEKIIVLDNPASAFMKDEAVRKLFQKVLSSQWSLDKDKISDKTEIKDLYARLLSQTSDMLEVISGKQNLPSSISATIQNIQESVDFMNALNQYVPYVQIPFHSDGAKRNSELYVYTNKKNAASEGEVSAFIHLDMENLGPTDVFVKLYGQKVTTNFTVSSDEVLDFIEEHMDILDKRLTQKGFTLESKVSKTQENKSPFDKMIGDTNQHLILANTSFDARV